MQKDSENRRKKQSHPSHLSKNWKKGDACWGKRSEREGQIEELVSDQNPGPEATPMSKKEREKREQRICQGRSDVEG